MPFTGSLSLGIKQGGRKLATAAPAWHAVSPVPFLYPHLLFCPQQVTLIHSKIALADAELLDSVRQEVKEILLRKGVCLLLSTYLTMPLKLYNLLFLQPMHLLLVSSF